MLTSIAAGVQAQSLTVADGTETNQYVPFYGLYVDEAQHNQVLYPSSMLTTMGNNFITSMSWYLSTPASGNWNTTVTIKMMEVTNTSLTALLDASSATTVWTGVLNATEAVQTIILNTPYEYQGGNLLVDITSTAATYKSAYYTGIASTGGSYLYYSGSYNAGVKDFLPKTTFTYNATGAFCYPVNNLAITNTGADDLSVSWNAGGSETSWAVSIDGGLNWNTSSDSSYTFTGLNPNTAYTVSVVSLCSATDSSFIRTVSGRTACSGYTNVPYTEDFENSTAGAAPNCWMQVATGTSGSGTFPSVYSYSYNTHNGDKYFEFESSATSADTEIVALPEMQNINGLRLSMWVSNDNSYPGILEVGVLEADGSFTLVDSLNLYRFTSGGWKANYREYITFFDDYSGSGERIALRCRRATTGTTYTVFVDDLAVTVAGAPEITAMPARLNANINTDLIITATVGGDMTSGTYSWSSQMADAGNASMMPSDNELTINYTATGTDTVMLIASNSLGEDTAYTVVNVRDLNPVIVLPYSTGFEENDDTSWIFVNAFNAWVIDTAANNTPEGSRAMYISADSGATNTYNVSNASDSYAIRHFQFDQTGEYSLSFDWRCEGELYGSTIYDYVTAYLVPSTAELFDGTISRTGWTDLTGRLAQQSTWQNTGITFTITTPGLYPIVFYWRNDGSSGTNPAAAIDNIVVNSLSCSAVAGITLDNISSDEMTFHWHPLGNESSWRVVVGNDIDVEVYDTTYTATELDANTTYAISVYAVCGYEDTSFATTASFTTTCGAESYPWYEDFTTSVSGNPCWNGNSSQTAAAVFGGAQLNLGMAAWNYSSGTYNGLEGGHYYRNIYGSSCTSWLITPEIDLSDAVDPVLSFDVAFTKYYGTDAASGFENNSSQAFMVIVSTDGGLTWLDTNATKWQNNGGQHTLAEIASTEYINQIVDLQQYAGQTIRIAFYAQSTTSGGDNNIHIDNLAVTEMPTCFRVTGLTASNITDEGATLTWSGTSESYNVYVITPTDTTLVQNVTDTTLVLSGLTSMTSYLYGVTGVCSGEESPMSTVAFTTACGAVSLPYTETFANSSSTRDCWSFVNNNSINPITFTTVSSRNVLRFSSYSTASDYNQYAYSPLMNAASDASGLSVSVVYATYGNNDKLNFGYISGTDTVWDPTDYTTTGSSNWQTYSVIVPPTATQFAIHYYGSYSYYAWVDSVMVTELSGDYCFPANSLHVSHVTSDSITLSWSGTAPSYNVYTVTPTDTTFVQNVTDTFYTFTGLTANTAYVFAVQAVCVAGSDSSDIVILSTRTACGEITALPWIENFDAMSTTSSATAIPCWDHIGGGYVNIAGSYYSFSGNALRFYPNSSSAPNIAILPPFADNIEGLEITFQTRPEGTYSGSLSVGYITDATDSTTFVAVATYAVADFPTSSSYMEIEQTFVGAPAGARIALRHNVNPSYTNWYWFVDTINVHVAPSCSRPSVVLSNITGNSVDVDLADANNVNHYILVLSSNGTVIDSTVITATTYTYTTLSASMGYTLSVYTMCEDGSVTRPTTVSFRTLCGAASLPFDEDFESLATSATPDCWDNLNGSTQTTSSTYNAHSGSKYLKFSGTTANMVAMPTFTQDISNLTLSFWTRPESRNSSCGTFSVGYITDMDDTSTFVAVETYDHNDSSFMSGTSVIYDEKVVTFASAPAGSRIAFRHNANSTIYYWYVDDISVISGTPEPGQYTVSATSADATMGSASVTPSGRVAEGTTVTFTATPADGYAFVAWMNGSQQVSTDNPYVTTVTTNLNLTATFGVRCSTPTNLNIMGTTIDGATLAWTNGDEDQNAWQVAVSGTGYSDTINVNANPCTLTGLPHGVTYTAKVRAVCGQNVFSDWSESVTFTTTSCDAVTGVSVSSVTANSAVVSWTAPAGATTFEIEYGQSGFGQGTGTTVSVTGTTTTITGLTAETMYDVYVRNICGTGSFSNWSSVVTFETSNNGIDDVAAAAISLYPNPASSTVTLTGIEGMATVTVVDMNGRVVMTVETQPAASDLTIDVTDMAQGAYFVRIVGEQVNAIRKLIVR